MTGTVNVSSIGNATTLALPDAPIGVNLIASAITYAFTKNVTTSALAGFGFGTAIKVFADEDQVEPCDCPPVDDTTPPDNGGGDDSTGGGDTQEPPVATDQILHGINLTNTTSGFSGPVYVADPSTLTAEDNISYVIRYDTNMANYSKTGPTPDPRGERYRCVLASGDMDIVVNSAKTDLPAPTVGVLLAALSNNEVGYTFASGSIPTVEIMKTADGATEPSLMEVIPSAADPGLSWEELFFRGLQDETVSDANDWGYYFHSLETFLFSYATDANIRDTFDAVTIPTTFGGVIHYAFGDVFDTPAS